jgi:ADP-dependent NAD(P)H-hydrate dehydratase / NAD(P)H-hydrate epimerase
MLTALESRVLDANSEALGIDVIELMGNAGAQLAHVVSDLRREGRILIVCGTGNNGGDGFAAAACLTDRDVTIALLKPATSIRTAASRYWLSKVKCPIIQFADCRIEDYPTVIDCALGTGSSGTVKQPYSDFIDRMHGFRGFILSADIPTGIGTEKAIRPDMTVTFHDLKEGMSPDNCGIIVVTDIGIPERACDLIGPGDMLRYPIPEIDSHKGDNGKVLVVGGGPYTGAPALSAMAAMRVGADLAKIATPESSHDIIASMCPAFTMLKLAGDVLSGDSIAAVKDAAADGTMLIGPGLGTDPRTLESVRSIVSERRGGMVIDADAITAVAGMKFNGDVVLTPHRKEAERLLGHPLTDPSADAAAIASAMGAIVLLKGHVDVITDGSRTRFNDTGTPGMTCGGTGDVLAGAVAGLMSKGMRAFDAACLGAYICGKAGEAAFKTRSYGLMATDVIEMIPSVLAEGLR